MILSRDLRKPFWRGFFHAIAVFLYTVFVSLIFLSVTPYFTGDVGLLMEIVFGLFLTTLSIAMCGYFIFFEPLKQMLHHHFQAGTVMLASTLGWLFIFLIIFVLGFVLSLS